MMLFYVEEDSIKRIFKTHNINKIQIAETEKNHLSEIWETFSLTGYESKNMLV